jgi:hypothetical protein
MRCNNSSRYCFIEQCNLAKALSYLKSKGVPPEDKSYRALLKLLKAQNVLKTRSVPQETIAQQVSGYRQNTQTRVQTPVTHVPSLTVEFVTRDHDQRKRERIAERVAILQGMMVLFQ